MELDTDVPFCSLYQDGDVRRILGELYPLLRTRDDAQAWARNLRFLAPTLSTIEFEGSEGPDDCSCNDTPLATFQTLLEQPVGLLQVTGPSQLPDCNHYAAISWVWQGGVPPKAAINACERYTVGSRECWIPHHILSRAINFAAYNELSYIWFDKECIDQIHTEDKELGINAMDIVYQRSLYPVALLQVYIATQDQMDLLCQLVEGQPVQDLQAMLELLQLLESDRYFTRTWCLQESTAGGIEMSMLIPHAVELQKPSILGRIPGEVETTIYELSQAVSFAYACVSMCDEPIDGELESQLYTTIDNILRFMPFETQEPNTAFDDPEYRQACNAAQALVFLNARQNHRVADRIAILANMCNYSLRLDTNLIEASGYGFSICAIALAVFNGDFSLSRETGRMDFAWGPRKDLQISILPPNLEYLVVRSDAPQYTGDGLVISGWLWALEELKVNVASSKDLSVTKWNFLKALRRQGHEELAQTVWEFTRILFFGRAAYKSEVVYTPQSLEDVMNLDGKLIYKHDRWLRGEQDIHNFFEYAKSTPMDPRTIEHHKLSVKQNRGQWLWDQVSSGCITVGRRAGEAGPMSLFDWPPLSQSLVFQPSSILDKGLSKTWMQNKPIFWIAEPVTQCHPKSGHRIVKGTGSMCRGYFRIPIADSPETFVFR